MATGIAERIRWKGRVLAESLGWQRTPPQDNRTHLEAVIAWVTSLLSHSAMHFSQGKNYPMSIEKQIRTYIAENFLFSDDTNELAEDTSFLEEGIMDSTGILELVSFVEETFSVTVKSEEIIPENFDSIRQIVAYIGRKLAL